MSGVLLLGKLLRRSFAVAALWTGNTVLATATSAASNVYFTVSFLTTTQHVGEPVADEHVLCRYV